MKHRVPRGVLAVRQGRERHDHVGGAGHRHALARPDAHGGRAGRDGARGRRGRWVLQLHISITTTTVSLFIISIKQASTIHDF